MNFSLKGWRTVLLNTTVFVAALMELLAHFDIITGGFFGLSAWGAAALAFLASANFILRFITDSPIFNSESAEAVEIRNKLETVLESGGDIAEAVKEVVRNPS